MKFCGTGMCHGENAPLTSLTVGRLIDYTNNCALKSIIVLMLRTHFPQAAVKQ